MHLACIREGMNDAALCEEAIMHCTCAACQEIEPIRDVFG